MAWLAGWSHAKDIDITGQAGSGTDYQVEFEIGDSAGGDFHLEGHCTNFPQDIEVTDDNGTTLLDFWIEDIAADPIVVHVEVDDDLGSNQTVRVYYGKSGATTNSDIGATFLFGDDFSVDLSKWSQISASAAITSGIVKAYPTANYGGLKSVSSVDISSPRMMEARVRMNTAANQQNGVGFFDRTDATQWYQHPSVFVRQYEFTYHNMYGILDIEGTHYGGNVLHDPSDANWHRYKIKAEEGAYPTFWFDASTLTIEHNVGVDTYYLWAPKAYNTHSADEWTETDWIFVRKYNDPEPAFSSAGAEQNAPTVGVRPPRVFSGPFGGPFGGPIQ